MAVALSADREAQAQKLANDLNEQAFEHLLVVARMLVVAEERTLFGATEYAIRDELLKCSGQAYTHYLAQKNGYRGASLDCPQCGHTAPFHSYRERNPQSLGGMIGCQRAYYYCRTCGHGFAPWDEAVGLSERNLTPALEQLATLAGAVADSFHKGGDLLAKIVLASGAGCGFPNPLHCG